MEDKCCFVQFLHPGGEHEPDHGDCKHWNIEPKHRRKFLRVPGHYRSDSSEAGHSAEIAFWGEWEPQSRVRALVNSQNGLPHFLHVPYFAGAPKHDAQNTDPFVFGDRFLYTECQQHRVTGATQLRYLTRGSVILFGSHLKGSFVLDTVFVVDEYVDHCLATYGPPLARRLSETYENATIHVLYQSEIPDLNDHRLYFGATPERAVGRMFSFFPCLPLEQSGAGFPRPKINLPGYITQIQTQGFNRTPVLDIDGMQRLWDRVVAQVTSAGLALGTSAELPRAEHTCPLETRSSKSAAPRRTSCSPPRRPPREDC